MIYPNDDFSLNERYTDFLAEADKQWEEFYTGVNKKLISTYKKEIT
jgi:hypothetical protein